MGNVLKVIFKIGLFGLIGLVVLFAAFMAFSAWLAHSNNQPKGSNLEVLKANKSNGKKALIVYQPSKTNASKFIAHQIAKGLNDSGYEVTMNYPGKELSKDISKYSLLVFGSPVYVGKVSTVLTEYMKALGDLSDKRVVIYSVGSLKEEKEMDSLKKALTNTKPYLTRKLSPNNKDEAYELGKKAAGE